MGCPVNGPAVAARQSAVAVAWFTARDELPKVQLALSANSGEDFSAPILVAGPNTSGRIDTVILQSGEVVVSWLDTAETDAKIMLSRFTADGDLVDLTEVAKTSASRRSGFPVIERVGNAVYVSWTDLSGLPEVRAARVTFK
jgi:flavin reductase (DIM6/NTAB) family NADH-FMN oxidoreductase RutF